MTAPSPVPSNRPRLVEAAFWVWLVAAVMLVAFGLMLATSGGHFPVLYRGFGVLFALAGGALGFAAGKIRQGHQGFRRAAIGLSLGLVGLLALFSLFTKGVVWLLIMIAVMVGVVLVTRAAPQAWYESEGAPMTEDRAEAGNWQAPHKSEVLFSEPGASWLWLLAGPAAGIAMALIQLSAGYGIQWFVPSLFFVLVSGFLALQVKAARIHTSVELTADRLRQGTETTLTEEIVRVYPEATGKEAPKWQYARALGELTGVPRGRTGIGVRLSNDRTAQAWARKHHQLRAALTNLVEERIPPEPTS